MVNKCGYSQERKARPTNLIDCSRRMGADKVRDHICERKGHQRFKEAHDDYFHGYEPLLPNAEVRDAGPNAQAWKRRAHPAFSRLTG